MGTFVTPFTLLQAFLPTVGFNKVLREVPPNLVTAVPFVTVARIGGLDQAVVVDRPRVQVDVFASTDDTAEQLGEQLRTALRTGLPHFMHGGAVVTAVATLSGPRLLAWSKSQVSRSTARYEIAVHQYSGIGP